MLEKDKINEKAKERENELREECDKYVKSNEDLFNENEQINQDIDDLRNQHIINLSQSNLSAAGGAASDDSVALEAERKKHSTTQQLLSDYI